MGSHISRANAAIIDLRNLLAKAGGPDYYGLNSLRCYYWRRPSHWGSSPTACPGRKIYFNGDNNDRPINIAAALGVLGMVVAIIIYMIVKTYDPGSDALKKIADAIHEGAMVFMKRNILSWQSLRWCW